MPKELKIGIQGVGILHTDQEVPDVDTKFRMAKEAGFDYMERSPAPAELEAHLQASEKYGLPLLSSGYFYTAGRDEELLERNLRTASSFGARTHNVQILTRHADGHVLSDEEVVKLFLRAAEIGTRYNIKPCFEDHVNMWSEHFGRVETVAKTVEAGGVPFNMTLDHSHVIFKMDNPVEQQIQDMKSDIDARRLILDPARPGNVAKRWIDANYVVLFQARPAIPNGPANIWAKHPDGSFGRGLQYPWLEPKTGEWHSPWDEAKLEPWKITVRDMLRHHATRADSRLEFITMEMIPMADYGAGAKYSIFDNNVACAEWIRNEWRTIAGA